MRKIMNSVLRGSEMKMKYPNADVDDLIGWMSLEKDQTHGEDHEFSFQDVKEKMRHPCVHADDLIKYQSLELVRNNWTREINLRLISI